MQSNVAVVWVDPDWVEEILHVKVVPAVAQPAPDVPVMVKDVESNPVIKVVAKAEHAVAPLMRTTAAEVTPFASETL